MVELESLLNAVAQGTTTVEKAKVLIEKDYIIKKQKKSPSLEKGKSSSTREYGHEGLKMAFEKLKKTVNMPYIDKIQENISNNFHLFGFSPNTTGIESK